MSDLTEQVAALEADNAQLRKRILTAENERDEMREWVKRELERRGIAAESALAQARQDAFVDGWNDALDRAWNAGVLDTKRTRPPHRPANEEWAVSGVWPRKAFALKYPASPRAEPTGGERVLKVHADGCAERFTVNAVCGCPTPDAGTPERVVQNVELSVWTFIGKGLWEEREAMRVHVTPEDAARIVSLARTSGGTDGVR